MSPQREINTTAADSALRSMPRMLSAGKAIPITERARRGPFSHYGHMTWDAGVISTSCDVGHLVGFTARFLRSQGPAYSRTIPNNPFAWAALSNSVTTRLVRFRYVVADA